MRKFGRTYRFALIIVAICTLVAWVEVFKPGLLQQWIEAFLPHGTS